MKTKLLLLLEEFEGYKNKFFDKVKQEGFDANVAEKWWQIISGQASYSFAKSHSYPYSKLTYLTMYLKAKYPKQFILSLLNNTQRAKEDKEGINKLSTIIFSAKRDYNVPIYPPHYNKSDVKFKSEGAGIRFGLNAIKDIGKSAEAIVENRPYEDFSDFLDKSHSISEINKRSIMALIFSGAFNTTNNDKNELIKLYTGTKSKKSNQLSFLDLDKLRAENPDIKIETYDKLQLIQKEIEYINMTFEDLGHSEDFPSLSRVDLAKMNIKFSAYVETVKEKISKNKNQYALLRLTDFNEYVNIMCFNKLYQYVMDNKIKRGMMVRVIANKPDEDSTIYFAEVINLVENIN